MATDAEIVERVLLERQPRSFNDPNYVPWWAKPPHGEKMQTTYTTRSGVTVSSGRVTALTVRVDPPKAEKPKEVPSRPSEPLPELCDRWGLPHSLYLNAPNRGIGAMRVWNAIKKATRESLKGGHD